MDISKKTESKKTEPLAFVSDEHKLSAGSIVLTVMMMIFLLIASEKAVYDLRKAISNPAEAYPYYCLSELNSLSYGYESTEVAEICKEILKIKKEYAAKNTGELQSKRETQRLTQGRLNVLKKQYDTSLLENIADEKNLRENPTDTRSSILKLENDLDQINKEISEIEKTTLKPLEEKITGLRGQAKKQYDFDKKIYELKIFGLNALFIIPFFLAGFFWYRRSIVRMSKWGFLPLSILIVSSMLAVQEFSRFVWSWLPKEFFKEIWAFLSKNPITRIFGYYIVMGGIILVFVGLIYILQRKLFSFKRTALRRLGTSRCPYCAFPLHEGKIHCSGCGSKLLQQCGACGKKTYKFMMYCEECGEKQGEKQGAE